MKTNTAIIIVLVFFFRLLFVNIYLFASVGTSPAGNDKTVHYSISFKSSRDTNLAANDSMKEFAVAELCEEKEDGEEKLKTNSPFLLSFFSFFLNNIAHPIQQACTFDSIKCNLYPKKYLSLSVLRI